MSEVGKVEYKTSALCILQDGINVKNKIALQWEHGGGFLKICEGSKDVALSSTQLEQLLPLIPAIVADLRKGKKVNHEPPPGFLTGVPK
jgi:hypothetical protein